MNMERAAGSAQPDADKAASRSLDDLRGFLQTLKSDHPREIITVNDALSGDWELAAVTSALEQKLRVPVIEYTEVKGSTFTIVHNVCSSLARIARVLGCTATELEDRLSSAYDSLIAPEILETGPVREIVHQGDAVDLTELPSIRYTDTQTHPYISAACVVARDSVSDAMNISFNRMMIQDRNTMAIYMTPGSDLDTIFRKNQSLEADTPVVVFLGSHPLWSLGSLASGPLSLDEYSVIGGLLGYPLPVVPGLHDASLAIPAHAEMAFEGVLSCTREIDEGPYGEAFGYVSDVSRRPVLQIQSFTHRRGAVFQDIVPGKIEHMTMTSVAIKAHLRKALVEQFDCLVGVHLPAPMTVYVAVTTGTLSAQVHEILTAILMQQRFVKHAVVFDADVKLDNAKQTQRALAMHVQLDRDLVMLPNQRGNGLDPSEHEGKTTKWGVDATATTVAEGLVEANQLPEAVVNGLDVDAIWKRAQEYAKRNS